MPARASRSDASSAAVIRPPVDVAVLEDLVGDEPSVVRHFLELYLRTARAQADEIAAACAAGDGARIRSAAHTLKASSRSIGARELGDLCAALERATDRDEVVEGCARFDRAVREVEAFIAQRLDAA